MGKEIRRKGGKRYRKVDEFVRKIPLKSGDFCGFYTNISSPRVVRQNVRIREGVEPEAVDSTARIHLQSETTF